MNTHKLGILRCEKVFRKHNLSICSTIQFTKMIKTETYKTYRKGTKVKFTPNEIAVIKMICEQLTNKEVAERLGLSRRTIDGYREQIMKKIKAKGTAGLVIYAIKNNIYKLKFAS